MFRLTECRLCKGRSLFTLYRQTIDYSSPWTEFLERSNFPLTVQGKICTSCGWIFKDIGYDAEELARLYNLEEEAASAEAEMLAVPHRRVFQKSGRPSWRGMRTDSTC